MSTLAMHIGLFVATLHRYHCLLCVSSCSLLASPVILMSLHPPRDYPPLPSSLHFRLPSLLPLTRGIVSLFSVSCCLLLGLPPLCILLLSFSSFLLFASSFLSAFAHPAFRFSFPPSSMPSLSPLSFLRIPDFCFPFCPSICACPFSRQHGQLNLLPLFSSICCKDL